MSKLVHTEDVKDLLMGIEELPWEENVDDLVDSLPTVEVVHGRWENITGGMVMLGDCSECKVRQPVIGTNYCKNCGVKMDGDSDAT